MATNAKPETSAKAETEATIKNRLNDQAMRQVRDAHREEYDGIVSALYKEAGLEYKRRLTKEEKAAEQIRKIAAEAGIDLGVLADEIDDEAARNIVEG